MGYKKILMISQKAIDLILEEEGCDLTPNWPGGDSGVTYGRGYDLGYNNKDQIKRDWGSFVTKETLDFMLSCSGLKGQQAKEKINPLTRIYKINQRAADSVFLNNTLPRFEKLALETYPGLELLEDNVRGAIVSLVFNRGTSFGTEGKPSWESRREMRALKPLIEAGDLQSISDTIRSMKRLWAGKGLNGLLRRRDREADLILN